LRGWLYDWFFPTRYFRHSAIFRVYFIFAISVLAIIATRDLASATRQPTDSVWRRFLAASGLVAICALVVFLFFIHQPANARVPPKWIFLARVHAFLVWPGVCVAAVAASLSSARLKRIFLACAHAFLVWPGVCAAAIAASLSSARFRRWVLPALLLALSASDAFLTTAISSWLIADESAFGVNRWKTLDERHSASLDLTSHGLSREESSLYEDGGYRLDLTNDQMIFKIPVAKSYATAVNNYHRVMMNHPFLKQMAIGTERIWFSKEAGRVAPIGGNFSAFVRRVDARRDFPLVVHSREELLQLTQEDTLNPTAMEQIAKIESLPAVERMPVRLLKYLPDELTFEAMVAGDGWLLVTDRWARGWRAEINGKPVEVYGGNFIFRALSVSPGLNTVRFRYEPAGFPWLLILSWGTLGLVALRSIHHHWLAGDGAARPQ
jgi:hypothetical protein